jgi:hypothetical protein
MRLAMQVSPAFFLEYIPPAVSALLTTTTYKTDVGWPPCCCILLTPLGVYQKSALEIDIERSASELAAMWDHIDEKQQFIAEVLREWGAQLIVLALAGCSTHSYV